MDTILGFFRFLEWYFLGKHSGRVTKAGHVLWLHEDDSKDYDNVFKELALSRQSSGFALTVMIQPVGICFPHESHDVADEYLVLYPRDLEQAHTMMLYLMQKIRQPLVVVFNHLSMLPCRADFKRTTSLITCQKLYERSYQRLNIAWFKFASNHTIRLIVIENKAILSKKNSAFLRRLFRCF